MTPLMRLYIADGWCETDHFDRDSPYVEVRESVNVIDEEVTMARLTSKGRRKAEHDLIKQGHNPCDAQGIAWETRTWRDVARSPHAYDSLCEGCRTLKSWTDVPMRMETCARGTRVYFTDLDDLTRQVNQVLGWEQHKRHGHALRRSLSPATEWLWSHLYANADRNEDLVLWHTT